MHAYIHKLHLKLLQTSWMQSMLESGCPTSSMSCPMGERRLTVNKRCPPNERCAEEDITVLEEHPPVLVVPVDAQDAKAKVNLSNLKPPVKGSASAKRWDEAQYVVVHIFCILFYDIFLIVALRVRCIELKPDSWLPGYDARERDIPRGGSGGGGGGKHGTV